MWGRLDWNCVLAARYYSCYYYRRCGVPSARWSIYPIQLCCVGQTGLELRAGGTLLLMLLLSSLWRAFST
ncbi:MAG: hypothetical protein IKX35_06290 [Bacteroidales bacterium]|nr:hypothetical protein [Bacteroidales bacterium]